MRYFVLFAFLFLAACADDTSLPEADAAPPATSTAQAVDAFCVAVCGWADQCGAPYYPDACGELCGADCLASCTREVCAAAGVDCASSSSPLAGAELDACVAGVEASTRDCTQYRPHPAGCATFILPEAP